MNPGWITAIVLLCIQAGFGVRGLYRRARNSEIAHAFVRDMATNHLPHIYGALRQIAEHNGIELQEPPLVHFVELNGHSRRFENDGPE